MATDLTKPVQTRNGRPARIVSTSLRGPYPIAAIVSLEGGHEAVISLTPEGRFTVGDGECAFDLVNVPETHTFWLNIYENRMFRHPSRGRANLLAEADRIACVEVTYTEGEGL